MRISLPPSVDLPAGGEMSAEDYLSLVGRADDPARRARTTQDAPESTETVAKTLMDEWLSLGGFGRVEREARVWPGRRFRADWFLPDQRPPVVVEYDAIKGGGAHASVGGVLRDSEKGNLAQSHGLRFYRVNARSIHDGTAFAFLDAVLERIG